MQKKSILILFICLVLFALLIKLNANYTKFDESIFLEEEILPGKDAQKLYNMETILREKFGDKYDDIFGGCWLNEDYEPYFAVTHIDEEILYIASEIGLTVLGVKYSYFQLLEVLSNIPVSIDIGIYMAEIAESENAIEISIDKSQLDSIIALLIEDEYLANFEDSYYFSFMEGPFEPYTQ